MQEFGMNFLGGGWCRVFDRAAGEKRAPKQAAAVFVKQAITVARQHVAAMLSLCSWRQALTSSCDTSLLSNTPNAIHSYHSKAKAFASPLRKPERSRS